MNDLILHIETDLVMLLSLLRGYEILCLDTAAYVCWRCLSVAELELGGDTFVV